MAEDNAPKPPTPLLALFVGGPLDGQIHKTDTANAHVTYRAPWPLGVLSLDTLKSFATTPEEMMLAALGTGAFVDYAFSRWQVGAAYVNLMLPIEWTYGRRPAEDRLKRLIRRAVLEAVSLADPDQIARIG